MSSESGQLGSIPPKVQSSNEKRRVVRKDKADVFLTDGEGGRKLVSTQGIPDAKGENDWMDDKA